MAELKPKDIEAITSKIDELKLLVLPADYYMDIKALSQYSCISVRKLKELIRHPEYPIPAYKVEGSIKVKKSEFEIWVKRFRLSQGEGINIIDEIVSNVMEGFQNSS